MDMDSTSKAAVLKSKFRSRQENDDNTFLADKFSPSSISESSHFILPEDKLTIEYNSRASLHSFRVSSNPLYLLTCYDEFSRNFLSVNVAKNANSNIHLSKLELSNNPGHPVNVNKSLLQYYHPAYSAWYSTFKWIPQDSMHMLNGKINTDVNYLVKINSCKLKNSFEPIFGTICVYMLQNDEFVRVTESFHFDATPEQLRKQFEGVYSPLNPTTVTDQKDTIRSSMSNLAGCSFNVADATGSNKHFNMFNITIPEAFKSRDLYFVTQLSKILTSDADKAVAPYAVNAKPTVPLPPDVVTNFRRLAIFRQPVGLGITKVSSGIGQLDKVGGVQISFSFYAMRSCMSDSAIGQVTI